ncbi:hypothetical protein HID58_093670, partial [Brassica napus]
MNTFDLAIDGDEEPNNGVQKHRVACKSARAPSSDSFGGPVIEMVSGSFARSNHSSYAPLSTNDPGPSSSDDAFTIGLPPAWKVRDKMGELVKAHSKALMPTFGDNKGDQRAVEMITHEITDLLRKSEKRLHNLSTRGGGPSEESNLRKNVQRSLATDLQSLSMELRRKQSTYLKRLQQQKEQQHLAIDVNDTRKAKTVLMDHETTIKACVRASISFRPQALHVKESSLGRRTTFTIRIFWWFTSEELKRMQGV